MKYLQKKILSIILFFSWAICLFAYDKPHVVNFSKEVYGAGNKNWSVAQDERGVMYFGNDVALIEFDGIVWKRYDMPNKEIIRSVAVNSHQTIFTGSYEEFGRWDRDISGKLVYTSLSDNLDKSLLKNDDFWKIWIEDDLVYFQSFNSIYVYNHETVERIGSHQIYLFLSKVRNEFLIQEMLGSLYRLKNNSFEKIENSEIFRGMDVRVILPYQTDKYLIGTATNGIYIYDGKTFEEWMPKLTKLFKSKELNAGIRTMQGVYYFGTILDGIYVVTPQGEIIDHISSENLLQNNTVLSLFEDNSGNVWAGLDSGISYIRYIKNMSCYTDPAGGTFGAVYGATMWNGTLFVGTNQGVFYVPNADQRKPFSLQNMKLVEGTQGQVWGLDVVDGRLYCSHNKGAKEIHNNFTVSDLPPVGLGVYDLTDTKIRDRDVLLYSTYSSLRVQDKKTKIINELTQIREPIIKTEVDHLGNIWLEHANKGVYKGNLNQKMDSLINISYYGGGSNDELPYKLKIFKVGGRIVLLGNGRFYIYDDISDTIVTNNQLNNCFAPVEGLRQIIHIKQDLYWALTKKTIYKFSYNGHSAHIMESYDIAANKLSLVNAYENISILNDSLHLVCLDKGFLIYNSVHNNEEIHPLNTPYIESFQAKNIKGEVEYQSLDEDPEISYAFNTVTFNFSAKNLFSDNLLLQYKLEGVDADWSKEEAAVNTINYARLAKGEYTFNVRTINNLGNHSEVIKCNFEILPPWYQSTWAYFLGFVIFVLLTIAVWLLILRHYRKIDKKRLRMWEANQLKMKNEQLENEIEEKNAELLTQASFVIQKNELLLSLKNVVGEFHTKNTSQQVVPLYQKINALLNQKLDTENDWKTFLIKFEEKHTGFTKRMKAAYPNLTSNDLRLCACLKLNLDTKDIASLMNLSVRAVENSRYRLRKKLNIEPSQNLNDFFLHIY